MAEYLALLRYQWWCLDSTKGLWFKVAFKCRGQPRKIVTILWILLNVWHLAFRGAALKTLLPGLKSDQRIARQEAAPLTSHPGWHGKLMGYLTTDRFPPFFNSLFQFSCSNFTRQYVICKKNRISRDKERRFICYSSYQDRFCSAWMSFFKILHVRFSLIWLNYVTLLSENCQLKLLYVFKL